MTAPLVLSLFPGIGLLDMAFEEEGFCVVRGPDLLWGGDVRRFHPPAGKFDGVIGGPPCQAFSQAAQAQRKGILPLAKNLIPEFWRVVCEAASSWWVMENVVRAPAPTADAHRLVLNNRWVGGVQNRRRVFYSSFLLRPELHALEQSERAACVTANGVQWDSRRARRAKGYADERPRSRSDRSVRALVDYVRWQGLPADFLRDAPFTVAGKVKVIGNGVPLPMGRAIAKAVKRAMYPELVEVAS